MYQAKSWTFTLLWMALVTLLSHVPAGEPPREALLRLSWKTVGQKVPLPLAEDPNLPAHMRAPGGAFQTVLLPYRLTVEVEGQAVLDRRVQAPGVHHDRPLSVLEELRLPPGPTSLRVKFQPDTPAAPPESPRYLLEQTLSLTAGRVTLITLESLSQVNDIPGEVR